MKPNAIISTYKDVKERNVLTYLGDPKKGGVMRCLLDFIDSKYCDESKERIIINYFPHNIKTINDVKEHCKDDDFTPIANFLKGGTSPNRHGTFPLTIILLEFDISVGKGLVSKKDKLKNENCIELKTLTYQELGIDITREFKSSKGFSVWLNSIILNYEDDLETIDLIGSDFKLFVSPKSVLTKEKIELGFKLAFGLYNIYKKNNEFNYIRIYADAFQKLKPLPIDTFFVNLSILNTFELKKKEELLKKENESLSVKIRRTDIFNLLSQEYISHKLIFNTERIIISGNPGTGKTTYTYKLCHQWIHNGLQINKQLIHIQLKRLKFGDENSILSYIRNEYLGINKVDKSCLVKLLKEKHDSFLFILDGFDEIETQYRPNLFHDLNSITDQYQFILVSRPYALLNFPIPVQNLIQIDGFNESSITNYLDAVITANLTNSQGKNKELKNIIKRNNILGELSHNPLMLSYIVSIFLLDRDSKQKLEIISSLYDLQLIVFNWLENYDKKKLLLQNKGFWPEKEKLEKLAWEMQHKKTFVISKRDYDDDRKKILTKLSESGLGNLYKSDLGWSFSFNTITFQEFFSVGYYAKKITLKSFDYLSKDLFFWNFNRMVSGFLSANNKGEILSEILQHLYNSYEKENKRYYIYLYYSLLSEAKPSFINNFINESQIKNLIKDYRAASIDSNWEPILLEVTVRIFFKLSSKNRNTFFKEIKYYLLNININIDNNQLSYFDVYYLNNLISSIGEISKSDEISNILVNVISEVFKELEMNSKKINKLNVKNNKENLADDIETLNVYDSNLRNILVFLFPLLKVLLPNKIEKLKPIFKKLEKFISNNHILDLAMIKSQYISLDESEKVIDKLLLKIKRVRELDKENKFNLLKEITPQFYIYCDLIGKNGANNENCIKRIRVLAYWIVKTVQNQNLNEYEVEEFINPVIFGLKKCKQIILYNDLFHILNTIDYNILVDIEDYTSFENYITNLLEKINQSSDINHSNRNLLFTVFGCSNNGRYLLSKYREQLFTIFKTIIEDNKEWITNFDNNTKLIDSKINIIQVLESFKRSIYFDFDKRYFINEILNDRSLMEVDYVRLGILSHWLTSDFGFFREEYWGVFKSLQNEINCEEFLFPFVHYNHKTFKFRENTPYLCDILEYLAKDENFEEYIDNNDIYVVFSTKLLTLLLLNKEAKRSDRIIQLSKKVLRNKKIRMLLNDPYVFKYLDSSGIMAFIMLYYLTQDNKDLTGFNYSELLDNNLTEKRHFIDYTIDFFSRLERGFLHNIKFVKKELGDTLYHQIIEKHKDFTFENFEYNSEKLSSYF